MEELNGVTGVAEHIGNLGFMVVTAAFFLVLSALMMIACFKWFKNIINNMLDSNQNMISDLLEETKSQNSMLADLSEALKPETQLRIKHTSNAFFDLAVEKVCHLIHQVKTENHIADKEATRQKIRTMLLNLHDDRKSKFDTYTYRGRRLSSYVNPEWVDWVQSVFEQEVYRDPENDNLAHTNVETVYGKIKLDLYHRTNEL